MLFCLVFLSMAINCSFSQINPVFKMIVLLCSSIDKKGSGSQDIPKWVVQKSSIGHLNKMLMDKKGLISRGYLCIVRQLKRKFPCIFNTNPDYYKKVQ